MEWFTINIASPLHWMWRGDFFAIVQTGGSGTCIPQMRAYVKYYETDFQKSIDMGDCNRGCIGRACIARGSAYGGFFRPLGRDCGDSG